MDPVHKGRRHMEFRAGKDPVSAFKVFMLHSHQAKANMNAIFLDL